MNSFESVVRFTEVVLETARTLKRLGFKDYKRYPLPSLEELNNINNRLDDIQPIYISASILGDANRDKNKHYYYEHLRPYLMIYPSFCLGTIVIDGEYHNFINGFDFKLSDKSNEEQTKYYEIVWSINNKLYDILKGMNRDMNYIFGEPVVDWSVYEHSGFEDSPEDNQSINPSSRANDLPKELDTPDFHRLMEWCREGGLFVGDYDWKNGTIRIKRRLAYWCYKMSKALELGKNQREKGSKTEKDIRWQPFEELFGLKKLKDNFKDLKTKDEKLKGVYPDIDKYFD